MYIVTRGWLYSTVITCVVLAAFYGLYAVYSVPRGGSITGYVLGILGTLLIIVLMLLSVRKRQYQRPMGRLDTWMRIHVFLGIITCMIVGMHAGFMVAGTISVVLTVVFVLVIVSGFVGTALYEILPHTIVRMGNDTFHQGALLGSMAETEQEIEALRMEHSDRFRDGIAREFARHHYPASINPVVLLRWLIRHVRTRDGGDGIKGLTPSEQIIYQKARQSMVRYRQLGRQLFYQRVTRQWLWTHIPLSAALMILLLVHIVSSLYY